MSVIGLRFDAPPLSILIGCLFCGFFPQGSSAVVGQVEPARFLEREYGLRKISVGNVWLLPVEFRLQRILDDVEPLGRAVLGLQRKLEESAQQNRVLWETNRQRIETLRRNLAKLETDDKQKQQLERQIRELEKKLVEPSRLIGVPDVRKMLIEFTNVRLRLALAVISIHDLHDEMTATYARLAEDQTVARMLQSLGDDHRLGPLQQGYGSQLKRLGQSERMVATDWLPIFLQSDRIRFGGLLNDRVPVTFTWQDSAEPTVLTASMIESAGLNVPEDAEAVPLTVDGRRVTARRLKMPSMRFGAALLRNIPVLVLPPNAEDLGARIGVEGFPGYTVQPDPERLRLTIRAG